MLSLIVAITALHVATGEPTLVRYRNLFLSKTYMYDRNHSNHNYYEAVDYCKSLNGFVWKLQSKFEAQWVADHITNQSAWVGVYPKESMPDQYLDGTNKTYKNYGSQSTPVPCSTFVVDLDDNTMGRMSLVPCKTKSDNNRTIHTICEFNTTHMHNDDYARWRAQSKASERKIKILTETIERLEANQGEKLQKCRNEVKAIKTQMEDKVKTLNVLLKNSRQEKGKCNEPLAKQMTHNL